MEGRDVFRFFGCFAVLAVIPIVLFDIDEGGITQLCIFAATYTLLCAVREKPRTPNTDGMGGRA